MRIACDLDGVLADMESALADTAERLFGRAPDAGRVREAGVSPPAAEPLPAPPARATAASPAPSSAAPDGAPSPDASNQASTPAAAGAPSPAADGSALPPPGAAGERAPVAATAEELLAARALTAREQRRLWSEVGGTENFWERLAEIEPGAVARLSALARERRWELLFITQRPASAGDTCQVQTQRWLQQLGFPCPSVFVIRGSRGRVAAALDLDVVIDDRPENCVDVLVDSEALPMLIWRGDPESPLAANARRLGIHVCRSMADCLDTLVEADTRGGKRSLLDRLRRLMGA